eukprot:3143625-Rhodomonas_salina.2
MHFAKTELKVFTPCMSADVSDRLSHSTCPVSEPVIPSRCAAQKVECHHSFECIVVSHKLVLAIVLNEDLRILSAQVARVKQLGAQLLVLLTAAHSRSVSVIGSARKGRKLSIPAASRPPLRTALLSPSRRPRACVG